MNNDLISIIVPVYKVEKYIHKCVDSIINQTYKNLEIILVDDGSPDNCPKICDEYAEKDDRVKVIHKKNGGLSEARNLGLEMAKGKYIGFVDSDDWIDYDMYEYLYNQLIINDCQVAVCGIYDVYEHDISKDANINKNFDEITILSNEQAVFECFNDCNINSFAWNKLYSKNVFENIRYPVGKRFEDMFVTHKIFSLCERIVCLPNKKYYYLRRDGSICSMQHEENSIAIFEAYTDRFEFAKQHYHNCKDTILKKLTELGVSLYNKNLIKPHNVIQAYEDSIVSNLKIYKKDILSSSAISFKFKAMMVGIIHFGKIYDLLYKKILGGKK